MLIFKAWHSFYKFLINPYWPAFHFFMSKGRSFSRIGLNPFFKKLSSKGKIYSTLPKVRNVSPRFLTKPKYIKMMQFRDFLFIFCLCLTFMVFPSMLTFAIENPKIKKSLKSKLRTSEQRVKRRIGRSKVFLTQFVWFILCFSIWPIATVWSHLWKQNVLKISYDSSFLCF